MWLEFLCAELLIAESFFELDRRTSLIGFAGRDFHDDSSENYVNRFHSLGF
jgi:hypothetical protein